MAVRRGSTITLDKVPEVLRALRDLADCQVMVGIPAEAKSLERRPDPATGAKPAINNALLGFIHENGSPARNIPARPFLRPGVQMAMPRVIHELRQGASETFRGRPDAAKAALHRAGIIAVNAVRQKITVGPFVPLKPGTLAQRRRRGRTGVRPLIDTGQLRNAITYVIRRTEDARRTAIEAVTARMRGL